MGNFELVSSRLHLCLCLPHTKVEKKLEMEKRLHL